MARKRKASMTALDIQLIADVINESRVCFEEKDDATINHIAEHFAAVLPNTNRRFDRDTFLRACGVESRGDSQGESR
jgi:hypothetical protein